MIDPEAKTAQMIHIADSIVTAAGDEDLSPIERMIVVSSLMSQYNAAIIMSSALIHHQSETGRRRKQVATL